MKSLNVIRSEKCMKISRTLVLIVLLTFNCGLAYAITLPFADDFENIVVGDYPNANGWQNMFGGVSGYVSNEQAHSGSRSLRMESYPNWARTDYVPLVVPDLFRYEAAIFPDPIPNRGSRVGFAHQSGNYGPFYNCFTVHSGNGSTGEVYFWGDIGLPSILLSNFSVGDWVTVRADLNFIGLTADLWVDGLLAATGVPIAPRDFVDPNPNYGHVVLNKWGAQENNWLGGGTGVMYLDDVRLEELTPTIEATIDIDPDTLNVNSKGEWITCYIELPEGYDVADIDVSTIMLNDQVPAELRPSGIGDYDEDSMPDLMVKFDRSAVQEILEAGDEVEIMVTGELDDGTPFEGTDTIRVIDKGGKNK